MTGETDRALSSIAVVDRSWSEQHQACPVSAADGNLFDLFRFDNARNLGIGAVNALGCRRNRHALLETANFQFDVERSGLCVLQVNVFNNCRFESFFRESNRISADRQRCYFIESIRSTDGRTMKSGG